MSNERSPGWSERSTSSTAEVERPPRRAATVEDLEARRPVHVVWELTLACDLKCRHCGSRAGRARRQELSTGECLALVRALAGLGARHVTLIGGEAYLRRDWIEIVRAIRAAGLDCSLQTGGLHLTPERLDRAVEAGLQGVGVSIDGLPQLHDRLRGVRGSFDAALAALRHAKARGLGISANTQVTGPAVRQLRPLFEELIAAGVEAWQVQLTVAMGRAADHPELLLQPHQLLELMPLLAGLYREGVARGLLLQPGNNVGYFGPYESLWRAGGDERVHWSGCNAGQTGLGIEADGTIKGCPSLPTASYAGGNVRDAPLEEIWAASGQVRFREAAPEPWGPCRTCYYAEVCQGGCTWTSHSLLGRPGNNPYCHHRALALQARGLRERVEQAEAAPGTPFDHGRFRVVLEALDGRELPPGTSADLGPPVPRLGSGGDPARRLAVCRGCRCHVFAGTLRCPHCGGDRRALARAHGRRKATARAAYSELAALMTEV